MRKAWYYINSISKVDHTKHTPPQEYIDNTIIAIIKDISRIPCIAFINSHFKAVHRY